MPNIKLRTNLIVEGNFLKEGTILDLQKVPLRFRKKRYIIREGERDLVAEDREQQMAYAEEGEMRDVEELLEEGPRRKPGRR